MLNRVEVGRVWGQWSEIILCSVGHAIIFLALWIEALSCWKTTGSLSNCKILCWNTNMWFLTHIYTCWPLLSYLQQLIDLANYRWSILKLSYPENDLELKRPDIWYHISLLADVRYIPDQIQAIVEINFYHSKWLIVNMCQKIFLVRWKPCLNLFQVLFIPMYSRLILPKLLHTVRVLA